MSTTTTKAQSKSPAPAGLTSVDVERSRKVVAFVADDAEVLRVESEIDGQLSPNLIIRYAAPSSHGVAEQRLELPTLGHVQGLIAALRYIAKHAPIADQELEQELAAAEVTA